METADLKRRRRVVGWVTKKFNGSVLGQMNAILVDNVRETQRKSKPVELAPDDISQGLAGRYADGGRAQFEALVNRNGWNEADLAKRLRSWRLQSLSYLAGSVISLLGALAWIVFSPGWFAFAMLVPGLIMPLALLSVAVKADFAAWQIRSRRFGGLREYFGSR